MLNFDADVKKTAARHQCENRLPDKEHVHTSGSIHQRGKNQTTELSMVNSALT